MQLGAVPPHVPAKQHTDNVAEADGRRVHAVLRMVVAALDQQLRIGKAHQEQEIADVGEPEVVARELQHPIGLRHLANRPVIRIRTKRPRHVTSPGAEADMANVERRNDNNVERCKPRLRESTFAHTCITFNGTS